MLRNTVLKHANILIIIETTAKDRSKFTEKMIQYFIIFKFWYAYCGKYLVCLELAKQYKLNCT